MKSSIIIFLSAVMLQLTAACCSFKGLSSCCGKGKCNIFCCNCDGGCKSKCDCWFAGCWTSCSTTSPTCRTSCADNRPKNCPTHAQMAALNDSITPQSVQTDEDMFNEVDINGIGHFAYPEFLVRTGWEDSEASKKHFAKFDRNGDGVITIEEMREGSSSPDVDMTPSPLAAKSEL